MRRWTFWEWIAYAGLYVGAVILAIDTGFKLSPDLTAPAFLHSPWWGFAPAVLITFSTGVLLLREFGYSPKDRKPMAVPALEPLGDKAETPTLANEAKQERVFVGENVTPIYLVSFFNDHTALQASLMTKPFIGKWMKLTGLIRDVQASDFGAAISLRTKQENGERGPVILLNFDKEWSDRLAILRRDDAIRVIGEIGNIITEGLMLNHCELVE